MCVCVIVYDVLGTRFPFNGVKIYWTWLLAVKYFLISRYNLFPGKKKVQQLVQTDDKQHNSSKISCLCRIARAFVLLVSTCPWSWPITAVYLSAYRPNLRQLRKVAFAKQNELFFFFFFFSFFSFFPFSCVLINSVSPRVISQFTRHKTSRRYVVCDFFYKHLTY